MKKVFLAAALALAVAGSWAFYPKAVTTTKTMMIVGTYPTPSWRHSYLTIITPEGIETTTELDVSKADEGKLLDQVRRIHTIIKGATLTAVNKYQQDGWELAGVEAEHIGEGYNNLVYVLEKK